MAHYASNLDVSPAVAPSPVPYTSTSQPRSQGSHLTLPELRSTSPLPPSTTLPGGTTAEPIEIEFASDAHSQSSGSVTYSFPTTNPFRTGATQLASPIQVQPTEHEDSSEGALQRPAWANEGLGSTELAPLSATSGPAALGHIGSRSASPLPPGAAPPARDAEPTRSGTQ
jgi:hypothetical protein